MTPKHVLPVHVQTVFKRGWISDMRETWPQGRQICSSVVPSLVTIKRRRDACLCVLWTDCSHSNPRGTTAPHSVVLWHFILSLWLEVSFASGCLRVSVVSVPSCFLPARLPWREAGSRRCGRPWRRASQSCSFVVPYLAAIIRTCDVSLCVL